MTCSRRSVASDARMIISGLRISCAITVDSRPSDESRSFWAASRWKRAIDSVSVLNAEAEQPRVLVVPGAAAQRAPCASGRRWRRRRASRR